MYASAVTQLLNGVQRWHTCKCLHATTMKMQVCNGQNTHMCTNAQIHLHLHANAPVYTLRHVHLCKIFMRELVFKDYILGGIHFTVLYTLC